MTLFDFFNNFWMENEREPFSTSETAMFHYLLNEANRQRWNMPIRCCTSMICFRLKTTKPNILKARENLYRRGIISYEKGTSADSPARYLLLTTNKSPAQGKTKQLPHQFTAELPHQFTAEIHPQFTAEMPPNSLYNNNINKETTKKSRIS